ncbi:MAG: hypothetical protein NT130_04965 [Candidatus Micrarchaeota archaeon]|nr:hypothetical protein [Candidatus Micrarchaeota archaeon]
MGEFKKHLELMREKQTATHQAFDNGQHSVVGDLAIKAVEQAIEADAARNKIPKHFGEHEERMKYVRSLSPEVYERVRKLWFIYGDLGYDGVDGERAKKAVSYMDAIIKFFGERWR